MRDEYDIFMGKYEEEHQCCPQCGSELYRTTDIDLRYCVDMNNKESYKDNNKCTCTDCGDVHIRHDRKPSKDE